MQRSYTKSKNAKDGSYELGLTTQSVQSLDDIWGALVKPEKLARWLVPVTGAFSKGGVVRLGDLAEAKVTTCEPKRRLALVWSQGQAQTALDISFTTTGKGKAKRSQLTLKITAKMQDLPETSWAAYGPAALGIGWELVMKGLADYLDDPKSAPTRIADFAASAEGRAFVATAFDGWRAAAKSEAGIMAGPAPTLLMFYKGLPA